MPTEADKDNAQNPGVETQPQHIQISLDTTALDEKIAAGVESGIAKAVRAGQPQPKNPELELQTINEDDDERTRVDKQVHNQMVPLLERMYRFEAMGTERLADLTTRVAERDSDMPYMAEYRSEIDKELSQLPAAARTNRETLKIVHDRVAMRHMTEIIAREREAATKAALQPEPQGGPTGTNSRTVTTTPAEPTMADIFDAEQVGMIVEKFGTADNFARKTSEGRFNTWSDYVKSREQLVNGPRVRGRRVIPFRRVEAPKPGRRGEVKTEA